MSNFDDLKLSVEAISGGRNTVILDDLGMPSIVVPFPKLTYADVITGGTQDALPAFIVDGEEIDVIYQSKFQNIVVNDRAYSLPFKDPRASIDFDTALRMCRNKGAGWHLQTNALFAAINLWCQKNGTVPRGNNNYGKDYYNAHEKGVPTHQNTPTQVGRTATGSGPVTWYHNYDSSGIADLNGNVWEWCAGLRLVNGEIQVIPYGNAMKSDCNMGASSTEWKAILADGTFVAPGTAGTLKFDGKTSSGGIMVTSGAITNPSTGTGDRNEAFKSITAASGLTIPKILIALGLYPESGATYGGDRVYLRNHEEERLPYRGSGFYLTSDSGPSALFLDLPRSGVRTSIGFRSAFFGKL